MALTIFFILCLKVPYYKGKKRSQAFFRKNSRSRDFGPNGPKMAQNGPKMVVNRKFLALTIFLNFGLKLGDNIQRKLTQADFSRKIRFSWIWA